jgi:orotidine-5'-phosphate decarboxylase
MTAEHSRAARIIVALDTPDRAGALALARQLHPDIRWFKVGLELFTSAGPGVVQELHDLGAQVFLDLKLHDIPNTVARAVESIGRLRVAMTTVHAGGGEAMMKAAVDARGADGPRLLAVTVLTSLDAAELRGLGLSTGPEEQALHLAGLAHRCGVDGAVCSPLEVERLRAATSEEFLLVTPGIRSPEDAQDDQARVAGPAEAMDRGATYLVVGRPITRAADPSAAARRMQQALA